MAPYEPLSPDLLARLVATAVTEGILVHEQGRILQVTPTLAKMYGYDEREMVGLMGTVLTVPADRMRLLHHIASGSEKPLEGTALRRDGSTFPVEVVGRTVAMEGRELRVALVRDITERRQIEWERAEQDARARAVVRQLPAVVWTTDVALRLTMIEGLLAPADETTDPRIGRPISALLDAHEDPAVAVAAHERALAGESAAYLTRRGDAVFEVNVEPLHAPDNSIAGVVGVAVDISGEVQAWDAARQSQERFDEIVSRIPEIFWIAELEPEPRIAYMSPGFERVFQMPVSRMYHDLRAYLDRVHPEDRSMVEATLGPDALAADVTTDYRIVLDDGTIRWIRHRRYPVANEQGTVTRLVGITEDVTERRARAEELRRSRRVLAAVTDNSPDVFTRYDHDGRVLFMSRAVESETGIPAQQFIGRTMGEMGMPRELVDRWNATTRRAFETGAPETIEWELDAPDGQRRTYQSRVVPERDETGTVETVLTTTRDITESVTAREALRASEARFRALVEHAADLIAILDPDGINLYASPSHHTVLGLATNALHGRSCFEFVHADDAVALRQMFDEAMRRPGPTPPHVIRFRDLTDGYRSLEVVLTDMRHEPAVGGIVANSRDVSEQIALEAQLRQAQKMEAVGQLAGGVAHDFNNILATVSGYAESLAAELSPEDPRHADAREISQAAARGASVAKQLLAFGRPQAVETEVLDLAAVVRETGRMLRPLLPASIALELPAPDAPHVLVRASRAQLEQIVVNLAVNARDAMPDGGTLAFVVEREDADGKGSSAVLRVRDTGIGMPRDIQERIFDPFFTTKAPGQGTGLGLSTVYGLVTRFGGQVAVASAEGEGTVFRVAFPLADPVDAAATSPSKRGGEPMPPPDAAATAAQARHVLLAEDETQLRNVTRRILERQGYVVAAVEHGGEALQRLDAGERFDVVLTDAAMPVMGGAELARTIAERHPGVPVILMSGYAELTGVGGTASEVPPGVAEFLEKPYRVEHLLEVVGRVARTSG